MCVSNQRARSAKTNISAGLADKHVELLQTFGLNTEVPMKAG